MKEYFENGSYTFRAVRYWNVMFATLFMLTLGMQEAQAAPLSNENLQELRSYALALINRTRREEGRTLVSSHEGLEEVAQAHSEDTAAHFDPASPEKREQSYLAHISSDGRPLRTRFRDAGVDLGSAIAENAGYWIRSPYGEALEASKYGIRLIHEGMLAEVPPNDSHRQTLLGPYSHIGIGLSLMKPPGNPLNAIFLVTDFSRYDAQEGVSDIIREAPLRSLQRYLIPTHGGPFLDVTPNDISAKAISVMKEKQIIRGYPDGTFRATRAVNRAEFLKMTLDAVGFSPIGREYSACFADVFNQWFAPYVCIAKRERWVTGYSDDTFRPEQLVNRAEAVTLFSRIFTLSPPLHTLTSFDDVPVDAWFALHVERAAAQGLLPFTGPRFLPQRWMTRGETAEMLYRETTNGGNR